MLLGCIADDLTGATDLAVNLAREGMSVVQVNGVPDGSVDVPDTDAVVVALKSRTVPAQQAIEQSMTALAWLRKRGAERIYFKYCSTFDSTALGNIGPVTEALQEALGANMTPATPAYPRNQRTVYRGHLFVGDLLLSESGMREHPLTPMADANLLRLLSAQTTKRVGLLGADTLDAGVQAVRDRLAELTAEGCAHAIIDATKDEHLFTAGEACVELPLTTGGAGLGVGLARALRARSRGNQSSWSRPDGNSPVAWLAGSCSVATRRQVAQALKTSPGIRIDPLALAQDAGLARRIASDAVQRLGPSPVLVYATAEPDAVAAAQAALGADRAALLVEDCFRRVATELRAAGVRALVVAGGETSGAVVTALDIRALAIGPEIDPGVPWTRAVGEPPLWLALKSGNFGSDDFFVRATAAL